MSSIMHRLDEVQYDDSIIATLGTGKCIGPTTSAVAVTMFFSIAPDRATSVDEHSASPAPAQAGTVAP